MKQIPLSQGKFALVDDDDYSNLIQYNWYYIKDCRTGYAVRHNENNHDLLIRMHGQIIRAPKGKMVDHIDGNGCNNQKYNLRVCTRLENAKNRIKSNNNSSGYTGVRWMKSCRKWVARITVDCRLIYLGIFPDINDAIDAYTTAAIKYHGKFNSLHRD
jgi:hypothetical protein